MGYVTFQIFSGNKTIRLPENLVKKYELEVAPITKRRLEYLALTSGGTSEESEEKLSDDICKGIREEISFAKDAVRLAYQVKENGDF